MPRPWTTRVGEQEGHGLREAGGDRTDARRSTIATWTSRFLSNRSASLPQIGVDTVVASRAAVITQVY